MTISFTLQKATSKDSWPSNEALLRHFRQFGNVVRFYANPPSRGYVEYFTHEEALSALKEPIQQLDGCEIRTRGCKEFPYDANKAGIALPFVVQPPQNVSKTPSSVALACYFERFGRVLEVEVRKSGFNNHRRMKSVVRNSNIQKSNTYFSVGKEVEKKVMVPSSSADVESPFLNFTKHQNLLWILPNQTSVLLFRKIGFYLRRLFLTKNQCFAPLDPAEVPSNLR